MSDTDSLIPTAGTSGPRPAARQDPPRTFGGSLATVALLLAGLFIATASPAILAGLLLAVGAGGVAGFVVSRRRASRPVHLCFPRQSACVQL